VIQFEGHIFWQQLLSLKDPALRPTRLLSQFPYYYDILYPKLDRRYTLRPAAEWDQLTKARHIHQWAADRSASWGMFQIMGFNAELVGFADIADFVEAMGTIEGQTNAFIGYLKAVPATLKALKSLDFATFARLYNGPGFAKNKYDVKLKQAYYKYKAAE
jgi:hypothetical protein